LLWSIR